METTVIPHLKFNMDGSVKKIGHIGILQHVFLNNSIWKSK